MDRPLLSELGSALEGGSSEPEASRGEGEGGGDKVIF